jgi:hypothetical protein
MSENKVKTFDDMYNGYLKFRKMSGLKESTIFGLIQFHRDCNKYFPNQVFLTKGMVDFWIVKRDTETDFSNRSRIAPIIGFLKFVSNRGWINFEVPAPPKVKNKNPIPHAFTEEELKNFFRSCDELEDGPTLNVKLKKILEPMGVQLLQGGVV